MDNKRQQKIQKLLALANDANDEESMTALAKAQELMLEHNITEEDLFDYKQQQIKQEVVDSVICQGRPQKWIYRLCRIIADNFRVEHYYQQEEVIELHFLGLSSDVQIAEITFSYAKGIIALCSKKYMQRPEVKRKWKRKWQLKQDYIEGYLRGLSRVFSQQVSTNGYELALQLPDLVIQQAKKLNLVKGKDTSHQVTYHEAFSTGYKDGLKYKQREMIT